MRRFLALAAAVVVLAACGGVPDSGDPIAVPNRKLAQGEPVVNADVVGPREGDNPLDVIDLLFNASRITQNRDRIGDTFLTERASGTWKRTPVDVRRIRLSGEPKVTAETETTATVRLDGKVVGTVSDFGVYQARDQAATFTINLVRRGVWQIDSGLTGVLVRDGDFSEALRPVPLYFAGLGGDDTADVLVPELRFMDRSLAGASLLTPIVKALLRGPSPWLAPVTRNPLPRDTTLRGNVTLQDLSNDVVVDLSPDVESARPADLRAFGAQVAWSLDPYFDRDVRLQVNGQPLAVPEVDAVQGPEHWGRYNAADGPSQPLYYVGKGALKRFDERDGGVDAVPGGDVASSGILSASIATDETAVALVKQGVAGRQMLWIGDAARGVSPSISGTELSRPTWGYQHDAVLIAKDGQLHRVDQAARAQRVTVLGRSPGPIKAVRLSPEGARLALVAGTGAQAKAYVGLFIPPTADSPPVLRDLRLVQVPIAQIQDIGWSETTPATVAVAGQGSDGSAIVRESSVDGVLAGEDSRNGLPRSGPLSLAISARAGTVPFVGTGGGLYQRGLRSWTRLDIADVRAPFYPG